MSSINFPSRYLAFFLLTDPVYGAGEVRADQQKLLPSYYFGYTIPLYFTWVGSTMAGGIFGKLITDPRALGMDSFYPCIFYRY